MAAFLRALGAEELPREIELGDGTVARRVTEFQHAFWAATGLYESPRGRLLVKLGRRAPLLVVSMAWSGRFLTRRELEMYDRCRGIEGVPSEYERLGDGGFARPFVEGHPLERGEHVGDDFFLRFERMLEELHARRIAFVDLQKCENVLVGDDGRPHLFDFQTAWHWPERGGTRGLQRLVPWALGNWVLVRFQAADVFHARRHWRRCRPDTMPLDKYESSLHASRLIRAHRVFMKGWRGLRRRLGL